MGCQTEVILGKNCTFSITTHAPDTGVLTDADSAPAYRVYEDETSTPIMTGSMAKLDDANTTGFYTEQIACTTANGFEDGKSYNILITATVDSSVGGISYGFDVITAVWSTSTRTLTSASTAPGTGLTAQVWTVIRGDTLSRTLSTIAADATITKAQLTVKSNSSQADSSAVMAIDSTSGLLYLNGEAPGAYTGTLVIATGVLTVPAATMAELSPKSYTYDIQVWRTAVVSTIETGTFKVVVDITKLVS